MASRRAVRRRHEMIMEKIPHRDNANDLVFML